METFDVILPFRVKITTNADAEDIIKFESSIGNQYTKTLRVERLKQIEDNIIEISIRPLDENNKPIQDPDMFAHLDLITPKENLFNIIETSIKNREFVL